MVTLTDFMMNFTIKPLHSLKKWKYLTDLEGKSRKISEEKSKFFFSDKHLIAINSPSKNIDNTYGSDNRYRPSRFPIKKPFNRYKRILDTRNSASSLNFNPNLNNYKGFNSQNCYRRCRLMGNYRQKFDCQNYRNYNRNNEIHLEDNYLANNENSVSTYKYDNINMNNF